METRYIAMIQQVEITPGRCWLWWIDRGKAPPWKCSCKGEAIAEPGGLKRWSRIFRGKIISCRGGRDYPPTTLAIYILHELPRDAQKNEIDKRCLLKKQFWDPAWGQTSRSRVKRSILHHKTQPVASHYRRQSPLSDGIGAWEGEVDPAILKTVEVKLKVPFTPAVFFSSDFFPPCN